MGYRLLGIGLGAAVLTSCSDFVDVPGQAGPEEPEIVAAVADGLSAGFEPAGVRLKNRTDETAYYLLYDPDVLALYARCIGPTCPSLEPGATTVVPFDLIPGSGQSGPDEVVIEYWKLVRDGPDGWRAEDLRTLKISR